VLHVHIGRIGGAYSYENITSYFSPVFVYSLPQTTVLVPLFDINNDGFIDAGACSINSMGASSTTGTVLRIYFMNGNGSTLSGSSTPDVIIGAIVGNFPDGAGGQLTLTEMFCRSVTAIDDVNGDGMRDLAVATFQRLWIVMLKPDGSGQPLKIVRNDISSSFSAASAIHSGRSVVFLRGFSSGGPGNGMIIINRLQTGTDVNTVSGFVGYTVAADGLISRTKLHTNQTGLPNLVGLGKGIANVGDYDGNGVDDLAVFCHGTFQTSTAYTFIAYMNADGTVLSTSTPVSEFASGVFRSRAANTLDNGLIGTNMAVVADLNGDGKKDFAYSGKWTSLHSFAIRGVSLRTDNCWCHLQRKRQAFTPPSHLGPCSRLCLPQGPSWRQASSPMLPLRMTAAPSPQHRWDTSSRALTSSCLRVQYFLV